MSSWHRVTRYKLQKVEPPTAPASVLQAPPPSTPAEQRARQLARSSSERPGRCRVRLVCHTALHAPPRAGVLLPPLLPPPPQGAGPVPPGTAACLPPTRSRSCLRVDPGDFACTSQNALAHAQAPLAPPVLLQAGHSLQHTQRPSSHGTADGSSGSSSAGSGPVVCG